MITRAAGTLAVRLPVVPALLQRLHSTLRLMLGAEFGRLVLPCEDQMETRARDGRGCRSRHCSARLAIIQRRLGAIIRRNPADRITVFILAFCRHAGVLYGNTLVFRTLRVGFPTASVIVVDNASNPACRQQIKKLAQSQGCRFVPLPSPPIEHEEFLEVALAATAGARPDMPLVFVDPDVCFWKNCERFSFDGLMAGRRANGFWTESRRTLTAPRLHTSFLWVPRPAALWKAVCDIRRDRYDFRPFASLTFKLAGQWHRYDTGAALFAALGSRMELFGPDHLDSYDHLFGGTHLEWLLPILDEQTRTRVAHAHEQAKNGALAALRGFAKGPTSWAAADNNRRTGSNGGTNETERES